MGKLENQLNKLDLYEVLKEEEEMASVKEGGFVTVIGLFTIGVHVGQSARSIWDRR